MSFYETFSLVDYDIQSHKSGVTVMILPISERDSFGKSNISNGL